MDERREDERREDEWREDERREDERREEFCRGRSIAWMDFNEKVDLTGKKSISPGKSRSHRGNDDLTGEKR